MKTRFVLIFFIYIVSQTQGNTILKEEPSLKNAMRGKFQIGVALNASQIFGRDTAGVKVVLKHFNAIVAENSMKSASLLRSPDRYDFREADAFVKFGLDNDMTVIGHCLIWHSQLPDWFCVDDLGNNISAEELKGRMEHHIKTVVGRYKGRVTGWDVVNEAIMEDGSYRKSKFYEILGEEFIPLAFQYAQEADPNAQLYYNDYNEWYPEKRKTIVRLINTLKERDIRIDGVGMQAHVGMTSPSIKEYEETIREYSDAGVKVLITEFDLSPLPEPRRRGGADLDDNETYKKQIDPYTDGLPIDVMNNWNERMNDFFTMFINNSDNIIRVTMWGVSDGDSWLNNFPVKGRTNYPLLFDRNHKPKTIVTKLINNSL